MSRPIRERLTTAADLLQKAGDRLEQEQQHKEAAAHYEAASDVRAILQPAGWTLLRAEPGTSEPDRNVAINLSETLKRQLVAAADEMGVSLSAVVRDGYRAVVEGRWVPPKPLWQRRRPDAKPAVQKNLNVRIPTDLVDRLKPMLPKLSEELGYRVSMGSIAAAWMAEELGVDRPTAENTGKLKLVTSKRLIDHVLAEAERQGVSVNDVVADGVRALLAGEESAQLPKWAAVSQRPRGETGTWTVSSSGGSEVRPAKLSVLLPVDLLSRLRDWCADQSETAEWPVHPGMVGIAILKSRLGEPPAA
ncbi:hypothetical protein ACF060_31145 [Streptomyces werraensis]|uniref:hypothetical protein n=1 Tax=Streptomyces werraensis TaxID=68284 RepID=UPI0036FD6337